MKWRWFYGLCHHTFFSLSLSQPFCDGAHKAKAPGIPPLRFTPEKDTTVMLCACKATKNAPYCDGTHFKVIFQDIVKSVKGAFKWTAFKMSASVWRPRSNNCNLNKSNVKVCWVSIKPFTHPPSFTFVTAAFADKTCRCNCKTWSFRVIRDLQIHETYIGH